MEGDEGGWKYAGVRVSSADGRGGDFGLVFRSTAILFKRPYFWVQMGVLNRLEWASVRSG